MITYASFGGENMGIGPRGGGEERFLSLAYKICKKNKEDWTSVDKRLKILYRKLHQWGVLLISQ